MEVKCARGLFKLVKSGCLVFDDDKVLRSFRHVLLHALNLHLQSQANPFLLIELIHQQFNFFVVLTLHLIELVPQVPQLCLQLLQAR